MRAIIDWIEGIHCHQGVRFRGARGRSTTMPECDDPAVIAMPPRKKARHEVTFAVSEILWYAALGETALASPEPFNLKQPVESLVKVTLQYFATTPTCQPEGWIRSVISRNATADGFICYSQFAKAMEALRRC